MDVSRPLLYLEHPFHQLSLYRQTLHSSWSHITQMFDVLLASPLKSEYTKVLDKLFRQNGVQKGDKRKIAQARQLSIHSFLTAWDKACTLHHCEKAVCICGYSPFNPEIIDS